MDGNSGNEKLNIALLLILVFITMLVGVSVGFFGFLHGEYSKKAAAEDLAIGIVDGKMSIDDTVVIKKVIENFENNVTAPIPVPEVSKPEAEPTPTPFAIIKPFYTLSVSGEPLSKNEIYKSIDAVVKITTETQQGSGIILSADGYIVTNSHVIGDSKTTKVLFTDPDTMNAVKTYEAKVVAADKNADIALLKITTDERLKYITICSSIEALVGDEVCAVGNPEGLTDTMTTGVISALRTISGVKMIQTDAFISNGSSGGALLNTSGQLIGMTTSGLKTTGFNFAIASDEITKFIDNYFRSLPVDTAVKK